MGWFRRNWKTIAGAACGAGASALAVFVSPVAGIVAGAACTAAFGAHATKLGQRVLEALDLDAPPTSKTSAELIARERELRRKGP